MTDETPEDGAGKPGLTVTVIGSGRSSIETIAALSGHLGPLPGSSEAAKADQVGTAPTIEGPHGRAWYIDPAVFWKHIGREDGQVANWVIEAPWAHPAWHSYWLALVHLRPYPGMRGGTRIYLEGATHELWLYALDPGKPRSGFIERMEIPSLLTPMNFGAQLREPGDAIAAERVKSAAQMVVNGQLNPDTDAISQWRMIFGDNMMIDRPGGTRRAMRPLVVE